MQEVSSFFAKETLETRDETGRLNARETTGDSPSEIRASNYIFYI